MLIQGGKQRVISKENALQMIFKKIHIYIKLKSYTLERICSVWSLYPLAKILKLYWGCMTTFYLLVFLGISSTFLLCFLVGFVDFWLNAIYALCPLSVNNMMLLFTEIHPNTVSQRYKHKYNPAVKDIADATVDVQCEHYRLGARYTRWHLIRMTAHLLSWICPSTLCSSLPNMPHGLKFSTHLSPVLKWRERRFSSQEKGTNHWVNIDPQWYMWIGSLYDNII